MRNIHDNNRIMLINKIVIIINGKGGVGKDTLCNFISLKYCTRNVSSITPILKVAKAGNWNGNKDDKSRKLLSDLKHLFSTYNDLSFTYLKNQTEEFLTTNEDVLFVHIREFEEINKYLKYVTEKGLSCKTLLIKRGNNDKTYGNNADDMVERYQYDFIYENNLQLTEAEKDFITFFDNNIIGGY